jgi:hypothetical protein
MKNQLLFLSLVCLAAGDIRHSKKIKSEWTVSYHAKDSTGNEKGERGWESEYDYDHLISYDTSGRELEYILFTVDSQVHRRYVNLYNDKGLLEEEQYFDGDSSLDATRKHAYNDKGLQTGTLYQSGEDYVRFTKFIYNDSGQLVKQKQYNAKTERLTEERYFQYNADGKLELETAYWSAGSATGDPELFSKAYYKDSLCYEQFFYQDDEIESRYNYYYDAHRNCIKNIEYAPGGKVVVTIEYRYTYDSEGNWIRKIMFENGVAIFIEEKTIEYF